MGNYCSCNQLESTTELKLSNKSFCGDYNEFSMRSIGLDSESESLPYLTNPDHVNKDSLESSFTSGLLTQRSNKITSMNTIKLNRLSIRKPKKS